MPPPAYPDQTISDSICSGELQMTTTLTIKDIALDKELDHKDMATVRGGVANQANATQQANALAMFAPVSVANGAKFGGPANIQVDSNPYQYADNHSSSDNSQAQSPVATLDSILAGSLLNF
jgi:hypothetical protein